MAFPAPVVSLTDLAYGRDPLLDGWIMHFMTSNNLDHALNPHLNASDDQLGFMVDLNPGRIFFPCSGRTMRLLLAPTASEELVRRYGQVWRQTIGLLKKSQIDGYKFKEIIQACRYRFLGALSEHVLIPSRLQKRLSGLLLRRSGLDDPLREEKKVRNQAVRNFVHSADFDLLLNARPRLSKGHRLDSLKHELSMIELSRLLTISTWRGLWTSNADDYDLAGLKNELGHADYLYPVIQWSHDQNATQTTILYMPDESGEIIMDCRIIRMLLSHGYKVILALKGGFDFYRSSISDLENDPVLAATLKNAHIEYDVAISKNDLLKRLAANRLLVISDGQCEETNLCRASVTFARAWKEADFVLAKGVGNYRRFMMNPAKFTRDMICFYRGQDRCRFMFKAKSPHVRKYSSSDLTAKAEAIIEDMRQAKAGGRTIIFYSAIVGSIPGQTQAAITLLEVFVNYMRVKIDSSFIINPAEHFEPGLDGDDLMFMWEKVQRSGYLDIWRFQTSEDIEKSFELMGQKVPPVWAGKDATFSTGCTKEMKIALEMQAVYRELQIIGPDPAKFFRRRDYGVGGYVDSMISGR